MADIFLSYARADQPKVERLAKALEEAGYSLWWDQHIRGGGEFSKDIEKAIAEAKAVIVAWSATSVDSEWVRDEAAYARDAGKLVPVQLDDTMPPMGYRQRQAIDLSGGFADEGKMAQLAAALAPLVEGQHEPIKASGSAARRLKPALLAVPLLALVAAGGWWALQGNDDDAAAEAMVEAQTIAVLPFVASSSGEEDQFFADGVSEEILNRLDVLPELRVIPRTTAFGYKGTEKPLMAVAAELGVAHIVEGSVRRSGDQVRVTARLVSAANGQSLWSKSYEASTDDVFTVQADIAENVAGALDVLLDADKKASMEAVGVNNPEAFARYAKAASQWNEAHTNLNNLKALEQVADEMDAVFAAEPKLWSAAYYSADYYTHIVGGLAAGLAHNEVSDARKADAAKERNARLDQAHRSAVRAEHKLLIASDLAFFEGDWKRSLELERQLFSGRGVCMISTGSAILSKPFGLAEEALDYYLSMADCLGMHMPFRNDLGELALHAKRPEIGIEVLGQTATPGVSDVVNPDILLRLQLQAGDLEAARLTAVGNDTLNIVIGLFEGDRSRFDADYIRSLRQGHPVWSMPLLAVAGERDMVNQWAAEIDARPGGSVILQVAVAKCVCGFPFDLSATPNYRAQLERSGLPLTLASPMRWPLKDW